jgi:hypothetical protein
MLRIAKSSPGVLDLSSVKDEFGLPVTLNGESYRDVPDHELDNPVLQRVRDMQWVTVTKLPVAPETNESTVDEPPPAAEPTTAGGDIPPEDASPPADSASPDGTEQTTSDDHAKASEEAHADAQAKTDGSNKAGTKSDARKAGRRS